MIAEWFLDLLDVYANRYAFIFLGCSYVREYRQLVTSNLSSATSRTPNHPSFFQCGLSSFFLGQNQPLMNVAALLNPVNAKPLGVRVLKA